MILAPLSVDLDDKWSYLKIRGVPEWASYPTYLPVLIPRALAFLATRNIRCTWFLVGQDAALDRNRELLQTIAAAGHEIGNHSFAHDSWLHRYSAAQLTDDLSRAEEHIESVTGVRPRGFRGPGYSVTPAVIHELMRRDYAYDASTCPNGLAPLARIVYLASVELDGVDAETRNRLGGTLRDVLQPIAPYRWDGGERTLVEVPVTTLPVLRTPIHMSYLLCLASRAPRLARQYFRLALRVCRLARVPPSLVLHPLDLLGRDDVADFEFFCGMSLPWGAKLELLDEFLDRLQADYRLTTLDAYVRALPTDTLPARRLTGARG